jgi:hypothetical protein
VVILPGSDGEACDLFRLTRSVPDRGLCLACAGRAGWPRCFPSERAGKLAADYGRWNAAATRRAAALAFGARGRHTGRFFFGFTPSGP